MKREGEARALGSSPALPPGWASAEVGEIAEVDIGFAFKSAEFADSGIRLLRGENIEPGALRWTDTRYWPQSKLGPFRKLLVEPGDLILAMDRPVVSAGLKLARVRAEDCPCLLVQRVARLRGQDGTTDILHHALSAPGFTKHILEGGQTGTQLPHISGKRIENFKLRLPPKREQQRLAEALDSYLTRLDAAAEGLRRVKANLKRYRASVLKAAVEGRLVPTEAALAKREGRSYEPASDLLARILEERRRRWEAAELAKLKAKGESPKTDAWKSKYQAPSAPDTTNLPALPEGWCWATVDQLSSLMQYGTSAKTNEKPDGVPVIRMGNIVDGGLAVTAESLKFLPAKHDEFPNLFLSPGDMLFNRTNSAELVGKSAVYMGSPSPSSFASYLIRVRFLPGASAKYIATFLNSPAGRGWIASVKNQQVGQANVNGSKLAACAIPLPPAAEQERIEADLDRASSSVQTLLAATERDRTRLQRLRQSILTWAFEGKLVDQDPNDEPASVLLERIRQKRAAAKNTSKPTEASKKRTR